MLIQQYRQLEDALRLARWKHCGQTSDEEDAVLDSMDVVWSGLTRAERQQVNAETPFSVLSDETPPRYLQDTADPSGPCRILVDTVYP